MKTSINIKQAGKTAGILLAGLFLGWLFFGGSPAEQPADINQHIQETHNDEQGNIIYTCSMHPSVRQNEPGNCPICGMELIPVSESPDASGTGEENPYITTMTPAAMKLAEVQTTPAVKDVAIKEVRMPGKIIEDERRIASITAQFPGRIEELYVDFTGQWVKKGEKMATLYSPQLITAQKELIEAKKHKDSNPALYRAAQQKLTLWNLSESVIESIEQNEQPQTTLPVVAPRSGYVVKRNIAREDYVNTGTVMYQVADLSKVWVKFEAYERDLMGLEIGDSISFTVEAYPGETFSARISYIDPVLDSQKRTVSVRAEADNSRGLLKPQMLAKGNVSSELYNGEKQILIPRSSVLWTGERSVVYIKKPNTDRPTFEFREVVLGPRAGEQYVVKSGLEAGEEVVTNGNFKIDSAAQLAGKASMMNRNPDGKIPTDHDHGSTEMENSQLDTNTGNHQHTQHLATLTGNYLQFKNALANDEFEKAKKHLASIKDEISQSDEMNQHPEHSAKHEKHHAAMLEAVESASSTKNLEELRASFVKISDNLVKALQNQGYSEQQLYLQYCPMAQDNDGAYWISENEQITNPYLGQKMPSCGSTEKIFTPK